MLKITSLVGLLLSSSALAGVLYQNDFEGGAGPGWTNPKTTSTPSGRNFLGRYNNESATLTVNSVPIGNVHVSFDLFIIQSWDGSWGYCCNGDTSAPPHLAPGDRLQVQVAGGPMLVDATFANFSDEQVQTYPHAWAGPYDGIQPYPGVLHPFRSGASEVDTLGYTYYHYWRNGQDIYPAPAMDSVYHFDFWFPHAQNTLAISFWASGLQGLDDESWGVDNLVIESVPESSTLVLVPAGLALLLISRIRRRQS